MTTFCITSRSRMESAWQTLWRGERDTGVRDQFKSVRNRQFQSQRLNWSLVSMRLISSNVLGLRLLGQGKNRSSRLRVLISQGTLTSSKGHLAKSISQRTTPRDHMSALLLQGSPFITQGAMQMGDPTIVLLISCQSSQILQKPKSPSLRRPSLKKILEGLRSLCMTLMRVSTLKASRIWLKQLRASTQVKGPLSSNFSKVPPSQYSQTKQKLLTVFSTQISLTICLVYLSLLSVLISEKLKVSNLGLSLNLARGMTLMATSSPVVMCVPLQTVLNLPEQTCSPRAYCSIILTIIGQSKSYSILMKQITKTLFWLSRFLDPHSLAHHIPSNQDSSLRLAAKRKLMRHSLKDKPKATQQRPKAEKPNKKIRKPKITKDNPQPNKHQKSKPSRQKNSKSPKTETPEFQQPVPQQKQPKKKSVVSKQSKAKRLVAKPTK